VSGYFEDGYIEEDYFEEEHMAVTPLPDPPLRSDEPAMFIEKANLFLGALPQFADELDAVTTAMNNNSTSSTSVTPLTIASSGSKTFIAEANKGYLPGQTIKAASTLDGTIWMQGDVTAYNPVTGELSITMNAAQGSGTFSYWTLTLATAIANPTGSLTNDFSVKSLRHAIGASIASASSIDLSTATGNLVHVTGNTTIAAAIMTSGKDVWVIFDGTPQLTYHATNLKLNSGGANVTAAAGDRALFTSDGTTTTVIFFRQNGKAIVETAPPASAPVGSALIHFGSSAPANYLACPTTQTNVSRATYAALFAAIGTTWGSGDGSTTFGLPWFKADYAMVQASSNVGSASTGSVKAHTHVITAYGTSGSGTSISEGGSPGSPDTTNVTGSTGGTDNLAAGSRVLICVRYQ
jgi:microcystin-dependent protein